MNGKRVVIAVGIMEIAYAVISALWFFLPWFISPDGKIVPPLIPFILEKGGMPDVFILVLACIGVWLIPVIALLKVIVTAFQKKLPSWAGSGQFLSIAFSIIWSVLVMSAIGLHAIVYAGGFDYFLARSPATWFVFLFSFVFNAISIGRLITAFSTKDSDYKEYLEFKKTGGEEARGFIAIFKHQGIQKKLTLSFVGIIFAIIVILAGVLLNDFSNTLLGAIIDNGRALSERTASIIKASVGDSIAVDDYLSIEQKKNAQAAFPFKTVSYFKKDPKTGVFSVTASTDPKRVGVKDTEKDRKLEESTYKKLHDKLLIVFESPIKLGGITLGFASVEYDENVIYEPYFRTQLKAILIACLFIYLSIFLTYLFGRTIVFPILFLSMSVNTISKSLAGMIRGTVDVSSDLLEYHDRVGTKDEIKKLSTEIGNMTTVIRGVIPYISASTLKHSERTAPITEKRDLCFLFTDIRGFTTLCEGATPEKVVAMLNHFLEIQTEAIMNAGGEVDKFVGDEIMAMFEGEDKELKSCRAAMSIRKVMAAEREKSVLASTKAIEIGLGINSGPVVFGSVGAKRRMDFTSIGDTVNLAARLEGANKTYGTKSLITDSVYNKVKEAFLCREIDLLTVKGKTQPVRIYELLQKRADAIPKLSRLKDDFEQGLALYRKKKWKEARKFFSTLSRELNDETSSMFLKRIELFEAVPPEGDWDGVFSLTVK